MPCSVVEYLSTGSLSIIDTLPIIGDFCMRTIDSCQTNHDHHFPRLVLHRKPPNYINQSSSRNVHLANPHHSEPASSSTSTTTGFYGSDLCRASFYVLLSTSCSTFGFLYLVFLTLRCSTFRTPINSVPNLALFLRSDSGTGRVRKPYDSLDSSLEGYTP